MSAQNQIYVKDSGTIMSLETGLTTALLSTATVSNIDVQLPDKTEVTWVGTVNGTTVEYIAQASDLAQAGQYKLQVYLEMPTWSGHGSTVSMKVLARFK